MNRRISKGRNGLWKLDEAVPSFSTLLVGNWDYALGTSANAQQDGNVGGSPTPVWNFMGGSSACEVIASTGFDFPTTNCLKVPFSPATFSLLRQDGLPVLANGSTRNFRFYYRNAMPNTDARVTDWNFHPMQDGLAGGNCNWVFETYCNNGANWECQLWAGPGGAGPQPPNYNNFIGPLLAKNQTFRFEIRMRRVSTTTFLLDIRIHDTSGVLVADNDDFACPAGFTFNTISGNVPTTGDFVYNDVNNTDGLNAGTNDTYDLTPPDPQLIQCYEGAFCVADDVPGGWIGAYSSARGF